MDTETVTYVTPLAGAIIGMSIMLVGIFQGGLTTVAIAGGVIGFASIMAIVWVSVHDT